MKHPTPWKAATARFQPSGMLNVVDANGTIILPCVLDTLALEIVRCVNAHEALEEAVLMGVGALSAAGYGDTNTSRMMKQALTLAKETA